MLNGSPATRVFLATGPVDMRKSFDGLAALVRSHLGGELLSGHLFVFSNRSRDRVKVLYWDGSGQWVCAKRLEKGRFRWPAQVGATSVAMSCSELTMLLEGIDLSQTRKRAWHRVGAPLNR